jgi:2-polyprenyl-3-methyl-5-hydroxy-6-metoxy-1,4-benzoquinol methylase
MLNELEYRLLRLIAPQLPATMSGAAYNGKSKLRVLLPGIEDEIKNKVVLDFGCGSGADAKEMAQLGAKQVIGLDISEKWLSLAREQAVNAGVADQCEFVTRVTKPVEVIVSLDSFEHFADPQAVLQTMYSLLEPGGRVFISFGPTWYHPLGGHLFSIFPWSHIVLKEKALIQWRSQFKKDGARRFSEVEGGLNQMTIRRFEGILKKSSFAIEQLELVPIRRLKPLHNQITREFLTAVVRCKLRKPVAMARAA